MTNNKNIKKQMAILATGASNIDEVKPIIKTIKNSINAMQIQIMQIVLKIINISILMY